MAIYQTRNCIRATQCAEMSFEPCRIPPTAAFRLMEGVNAANWKKHIWFIDGDVTMLG